jgi:poly(3-hydroxybutyrate) depolymerase
LLTVEGELDDITGKGQSKAAHNLCSGIAKEHQHHIEVLGAGHYGIFSGRRWREKVYPKLTEFILMYQPKAAPQPAAKALAKPGAPAKKAVTRRPVATKKVASAKAIAAPATKPAAAARKRAQPAKKA